ncbi:MAG: hypothetical protein RMM17_03010 [Acidobacteriota bacterium]|nr:hypothetical protein [Blastocatellia bacterium]MDW8411638.1 hypothetical protein [Acidobacteriota bacterium]
MRLSAVALVVLLLTSDSIAWSRKGHILITRAAVKLIVEDPMAPQQLKELLLEGLGGSQKLDKLAEYVVSLEDPERPDHGLDLYSFRPDELALIKSPVSVFDSTEDRMHYLDCELFQSDPERRRFSPDGANKISRKDLPDDPKDIRYKTAGYVTFRVRECYRNLVASFKDASTNEIPFLWIGYLSHYLSDAYQPLHSTVDYQGFSCPCNEGRSVKHNLHWAIEGDIFLHEQDRALREKFWKHFESALLIADLDSRRIDPYEVTIDALLSGYDYLPMLCRAGAAGLEGGQFDLKRWFAYSEQVKGKQLTVLELKARRMAQAAAMLKALIMQAWNESKQD